MGLGGWMTGVAGWAGWLSGDGPFLVHPRGPVPDALDEFGAVKVGTRHVQAIRGILEPFHVLVGTKQTNRAVITNTCRCKASASVGTTESRSCSTWYHT